EGIPTGRMHFAGNVMIDSLLYHRSRAVPAARTLQAAGAGFGVDGYGVVTLHRPSNVDEPEALRASLEILREVAQRLPLVCALHPRTVARVDGFGFSELLKGARLAVLPPQGYLEMLGLMAGATLVLTDSGGMQEETTALGVPCLTLRENTERPITIEQGTNTLVGRDRDAILREDEEILAGRGKRGRVPELWDGRAAERIAAHLDDWIARRAQKVEA